VIHPPTLADAVEALDAQPFSRLLGARLTWFGAGSAVLEVPVGSDVREASGAAHDGLLCFAAVNALAFATASVIGWEVHADSITVDLVTPSIGRSVRAEATVVTRAADRVVCRAEVIDLRAPGDEIVVAVAQGNARLRTARP
jgi:acyl-coenzyme A thioesterase PaaI-like protein